MSNAAEVQEGGLRIVSPADGTVVEPGQPLRVMVEPEPGVTPIAVALISPSIFTFTQQPPFTFTVTFPPDAPLGPQTLVADGRDTRGRALRATITLDVEISRPVTSIRVEPVKIGFSSSWQEQLSVKGVFTDGQVRTITKSRETLYTSANAQVAKVSHEGLVEPVDNGSTTITVTYKDKSVTVPVKVELKKLSILMDIKPEDPRNVVNLDSRGRLPVAIFSTKNFDVSLIVLQTIRFGPKGARPLTMEEEDRDDRDDQGDRDEREKKEERRRTGRIRQHLEDINGDRLSDLLLFFRIQEIGLTCADKQATLTGFNLRGERITGTDSVLPSGPGCR